MEKKLISRADYMAAYSAEFRDNPQTKGMLAHRAYYGQFVTRDVIETVKEYIGTAAILASTDQHLNDIPLRKWDRLEPAMKALCLSKMGDANGIPFVNGKRSVSWSLSDAVCIAKEAARQIKESQA